MRANKYRHGIGILLDHLLCRWLAERADIGHPSELATLIQIRHVLTEGGRAEVGQTEINECVLLKGEILSDIFVALIRIVL